jgi:hypothetical protein
MRASQRGHTEIVQILLQDKIVEKNQQNKRGFTDLIEAS